MSYTGHWIVAVGGTLILCMAIINTVQRRPRNRFAWGYSSSRAIIGTALIIVGGVTSKWIWRDEWIIWMYVPLDASGKWFQHAKMARFLFDSQTSKYRDWLRCGGLRGLVHPFLLGSLNQEAGNRIPVEHRILKCGEG